MSVEVQALQGLDITVSVVKCWVLLARAGAEVTLLNVLGGLDRPTGGQAMVGGRNRSLTKAPWMPTPAMRWALSGNTWHAQHIPYLWLENIELPLAFPGKVGEPVPRAGNGTVESRRFTRAYGPCAGLSGGEQQRIAISIALANKLICSCG
ncbi:MAG: hypothetical protein M0C28_34675 [Candidatus Moduliflexus flocculans]|nr:hypothetical protein [Candidatus Moduliflexus flocculans]